MARYKVAMNGNLSLHGVTRGLPVTLQVTLNGDMLRAYGEFSLLQSEYSASPSQRGGRGVEVEGRTEIRIRHRREKAGVSICASPYPERSWIC